MQFTTLSAFTTLALATLATASPTRRQSNQCNTGSIQCCQSLQSTSSAGAEVLTGLLGAVLGAISGQVGMTCSPLSVIGLAGNSCSAQPVCCTNNSFNGVIALGCTPININL